MYTSKTLFVISFLQLCNGTFESDLVLTPQKNLQVHGNKVYYRLDNNETIGIIPWEHTLKHVTYLTLFKNDEDPVKIRDIGQYKSFMQSPYSRVTNNYSKFGDIITLAQGCLEKSDEYRFVEGACDIHCSECVLALWRVQKIRHRDIHRGFRYEIKFSVTPLKDLSRKRNANIHAEQYLNVFILKDDDYPQSFNAITRKADIAEMVSTEKQARFTNESPSIRALNTGEYFKIIRKASSKTEHQLGAQDVYPTTYRPTYHNKFPKPKKIEELTKAPKTIVRHHFHHHFFMNEPGTHQLQPAFLEHPDAIHIIDAPKVEFLTSHYAKLHLSTTTGSLPAPPSYLHNIPQQKEKTSQPKLTSFKTSEQLFEKNRYSDPDPLYENEGLGIARVNSETRFAGIEQPPNSTEPQTTTLKVPLSDGNNYEAFVFVEKPDEITTAQPTPGATKRFIEIKKLNIKATTIPTVPMSKPSTNKIRTFPPNATELPVLKWKLKQMPAKKELEQQSSRSREERVITITPTSVYSKNYEVSTKKSVSKSISVKVGNYSHDFQLM